MIMLSPGVYTEEIDASLYLPQLASSIFGIVTTAQKGPINTITDITNENDLINTFGVPSTSDYGLLAAIRYLRRGRALKVVRVAASSALAASCNLANTEAYTAVAVTALNKGEWGNDISIVVEAGYDVDTNNITVKFLGNVVEKYPSVKLASGSANSIATVINGVSNYISVSVLISTELLENGTSTLSGGNSGSAVTSSDIIGSNVYGVVTGMQLFADSDRVDINLLAVPGYPSIVPSTHKDIVTELITIAGNRGDTLSIIDPPYGLNAQEIVEWHNGVLSGDSSAGYPEAALNSSFAALYWPWVEVFDSYSNADMYVPPSGHVAGVCAFTDYTRNPWIAPAGLQRGRITDAINLEMTPDQGQRDIMQGGLNRVNPFVNFPVDGITLYGNQTLYRANSALTSVHVRRLLNYSRKVVATGVRYLAFEPNDSDTWHQFDNIVAPIFRNIKAQRGLYDFRVQCDATTNTADRIDRNEMWGYIYLQPTRAAEKIAVPFVITQTGTSFDELAGIS